MPDAAPADAIPRKLSRKRKRFGDFAFRCVILAGCPFHGEGHRKVWARLRMGGVRTSKRRVLRLMGEHGLLVPARVGSPRGPRNQGGNDVSRRDGTIIPDRVDRMWGTDLTTTWTGEEQAAVFIAVDHHSAESMRSIVWPRLSTARYRSPTQ